MRLDMLLSNSGRIPRRTQAKKACEAGLVEIDGHRAKPSTPVELGREITVRLGMSIRRYRVLKLPEHAVPRSRRDEYTELLSSESIGPD